MADIFQGFAKAVHLPGLLCLILLVQGGKARDFVVGGSKGWSVPSDPNEYSQWAEQNRFQVGDSLVFNYHSGQDSVQLVESEDYTNCNTGSSVESYSDGHTIFRFNHSGVFHFISGEKDKCLKNEKLVVAVLAERSGKSPNTQSSPPSPPPTAATPAPAGKDSPANEPPPSGAPTVSLASAGYLGALMAASYLFL